MTPGPASPQISRALLPAGLRLLILLRYKAVFRRLFFGSTKRRIFSVVGLVLMAIYILPNILMNRKTFFTQEGIRDWLPIFLLLMVAGQLFSRARRDPMTFQPAEIDLVVPGPYSRRQLVLYQIFYQVGPVLGMGLWMALFLRTGGNYLCNAMGAALLGFAINILSGIVSSVIGIANSRSRLILPGLVVLLALAVAAAVRAAPEHPTTADGAAWIEYAKALRHTPVIEALCLPTRPFVETFVGTNILAALPWALVAVIMNAAFIAIFVALDKGEVEALVTKSQEMLARREKAFRSTGLANPVKAAGREVPMLPRLGGAGPLLWRQLTILYRGAGPIVLILALLVLFGGPFLLGTKMPPEGLLPVVSTIGAFGCFGLSMVLRCDFRSDLDHIAWFKTLPLPPMTIVLGQIAAPMCVTAAIQLLIGVGLAAGAHDASVAGLALLIALASIPVSAVLLTIENTVFLLAPTRPIKSAMQGGFDPSLMGRTVLINLAKLLVAAGAAAVIGLPAAGAYYYLGGIVTAVIVGGAIAIGLLAGLIFTCARAFVAFNVADDQPA